jgi:hypothetical protein
MAHWHRPYDPAMAVNYAVSVGLLAEFELKDGTVDFVQLNKIGPRSRTFVHGR